MLGELGLAEDGAALPLPESARARALVAWLAMHPGMHPRSRLAGVLRPDATEESARKSVRDAAWAIRQALGTTADALLMAERDRLGLAPGVTTDLGDLRAALGAGRPADVIGLSGAELLAGMDDDWVIAARRELAGELDGALARLAGDAEAAGDVERAVGLNRRRAALDPLAEEPARALIRTLAQAGDRGRALSAYEDLADRLRRDLRTVPSAETRALAAAVRAGDVTSPPSAAGAAAPPAAAREIRYVARDGVNIAYTTVGEGPLDLVLVPGFVSHLEVFWEEPIAAGFLARLASFARVVLWDKRGQGLSDRIGPAPTLEQSKDDLLAVMDAAAVREAAILGVSEGGPMSILFAASHPERVTSLVLYGTHARILRDADYPQGLPRAAVERTIDELASGWGGAPCLDLWAPSRMGDPAFAAWWARLLRSGTSPGAVRQVMALNFHIDVREVLPAVSAPTLVVHARDEHLVPLRLGVYLAEHIPGAHLATIASRDHLPFGAACDELLGEIERFLAGQRPQRRPELVLTTVLFTDIVRSTEPAAQVADRAWRATVGAYHAIVDEQVARFAGRRVSTAGDGSLASFDGPARAVRCGQAIVAGAATRGLAVRAGVHTGECERLGDDLAGLPVHIGARIGEMAHAGEVLVSGTVRDLVVGSDLRFAERGEHELRGVPGRWSLLSARA